MLREEVPTTVSKPVISWFAKEELKKLNLDSALEVGLYAIESINANRHIAFEEEVSESIIISSRTRISRRRSLKYMLPKKIMTEPPKYWRKSISIIHTEPSMLMKRHRCM